MKADDKNPQIAFDAEKGMLELSGICVPDRTADLFLPILEWVKNYVQNPRDATTLNLKLIYLNSTSKRYLTNLLELIKSCQGNVTVNCYYDEEDDDMLELGETYKDNSGIPINFIPVKEM